MKPETHFKFREVNNSLLVTNEAGDYDFFKQDAIEKLFSSSLSDDELRKFKDLSILIDDEEKWKYFSLARKINSKFSKKNRNIGY